MKRFVLSTILAGAFAGVVGSSGSVSAQPVVAAPDLVAVAPGVEVIPDYDVPVFHANNYYWRFYHNHWWRSPYYNRGWVYGTPPRAVIGVGRPGRFVHYHPPGWHARRGVYRR